jgi:hypothetical protein
MTDQQLPKPNATNSRVFKIALGLFLTVPLLALLAACEMPEPWLISRWFALLAAISILSWIGSIVGIYCILIDIAEVRWPSVKLVRGFIHLMGYLLF